MQHSDFAPVFPGRLVPTVDGAVAFVPDPLLRTLDLDLPAIRLLAEAENALGRLVGTTARLVNPYLVGSPLLNREAILSSRIEGTITTPERLVLLQAGALPSASDDPETRDTLEVLNYVRAMEHGLGRLSELPVCLRLIREIHAELLRGVRGDRERPGEFRTSQNWIGHARSDPIRLARFVPPPTSEMLPALDDLEKYLHETPSDLPLLVRLALIHYQFEAIHPFRDGNGRIGRLLIPLLLCSHGRMRDPLLYLSSFFERNREEYMDRLLRVSLAGEWLEWIGFFLRAVTECGEEAIRQAEGLLALRQRYHERFQTARSSSLLQKLIDVLFRSPSITIGRAAELLGVTHAAGAYNIRKLQETGVLREATGRKRDQIFIAPEILAFMRDRPPSEP